MKLFRMISAVVLLLALAITVPAFAERGHEGNGRGRDKHADRGKPDKAQKSDRQPRHVREHVVEQHRERVVVERRGNAYGHDRVPPGQAKKMFWGDHRARVWAHEHRTWKMRGGYRGYVIPRERFVVCFGPRHAFRMHTLPVVVIEGHPRFHYNGFYVTLVDPWPEYWASNWYETDDVYVDYVNDGYYMFNRRHPGVAIAVNISL